VVGDAVGDVLERDDAVVRKRGARGKEGLGMWQASLSFAERLSMYD
jgi:hypothetical protein